ncbi:MULTISPECIES: hypothetical protein [unclassified Mesorhizobium]|uniref:hypothetical protein n=1 Tax=unclassified Mesorhizobium TaxID=325217 RepID=UPI000FCBE6D8|nr:MULTISPECIES: hypothetical protein [unclassified Mesorhizobium]RUV54056.1 hypothetical protein EOA85_26330 [Mesorhizobium sp. M5C.F.Ca.IN.020.29.1.1]RWK49956.1 MAG: hypothetical protein EOR48_28175 [Mesorhizobium sp.]TIM83491.1 MAG: hypothetical protein E5Y50_25440 [Mesorhizobium sp.]TIP41477.1 MAG: hypothetical protein E5X62_24910 [Mesorhizobium sp.]
MKVSKWRSLLVAMDGTNRSFSPSRDLRLSQFSWFKRQIAWLECRHLSRVFTPDPGERIVERPLNDPLSDRGGRSRFIEK